MKQPLPLPTQARLHELYDYSVITGHLISRKHQCPIGFRQGCLYLRAKVDKRAYLVHRLIWRWVTGDDPGALHVNHVDNDETHNAWHNLELVTHAENCQRKRRHKTHPVHKVNGVLTDAGRLHQRDVMRRRRAAARAT